MKFEKYRDLFPVTKKFTYLKTGSPGAPLSIPVREACMKHLDELTESGVANPGGVSFDQLPLSRQIFAKLINCDPEEIAIIPNATYGLNSVALMINPKKGENIVANDLEFQSNLFPWLQFSKVGVEVRIAKSRNGILPVEEIERLVDHKTRAVTTPHVSTWTGFRQELKSVSKVAHDHGAYFVVDAVQSAGVIPVDVRASDVDFLAVSSQKWLLGPKGCGFLFVRRQLIDKFDPPLPGWYGVINDVTVDSWDKIKFADSASKFEGGTPSMISVVGVTAGIGLLFRVGLPNLQERISDLTQYAIERLTSSGLQVLTPSERSKRGRAVNVLLRPGVDSVAAHRLLEARGILTQCIRREHMAKYGWNAGGFQISPCFFNNEGDIDAFVEAVRSINQNVA